MSNIKFSQTAQFNYYYCSTIVPVVDSNTNYTVTAAALQAYSNSTTGNITGGNIIATSNVIGNGSQLANITGANVVGLWPTLHLLLQQVLPHTANTANTATSATTAGSATTAAQLPAILKLILTQLVT
jgi:hypothetical protein